MGQKTFGVHNKCQAARESVWCELTLQDKDCLLVDTVYRYPNSTSENDALVNELLSHVSEGRSHILIIGVSLYSMS